jgi:thymidylate synthase
MFDNRDYKLLYDSNESLLVENVMKPLVKKLDVNDTIAGTVELIDAHFTLDPRKPYLDYGTQKKLPRKYILKELNWYLSQDLCINGHVDDIEIWSKVCSQPGHMVNSNYGWCIFSKENGDQNNSQYDFALKQLIAHPEGRQSVCFYSRPAMQWEWNDNVHASHDFTCTFCTQHFIRNNKLEYIVNMRSNDLYFGTGPDFAWHCYVYQKMLGDLKAAGLDVDWGSIRWNAGSLHIYERHWDLLRDIIREYDEWQTSKS